MINNRIFNKISNIFFKRKSVIAFILGAISYYMFLAYSEMAGGRFSPIFGDSLRIYVPAIHQFCRAILAGQSVTYSWTNSFGMNITALLACNVFSLTNILYLIFFDADIQFVTCIVLSIKAGFAAMFFEYYIEKIWRIESSFCVILALCYALSAYQVCFNLANFIWMDCYFMLPLVLYFLHKLDERGKGICLVLAWAYLFLSCFYIAYFVGVFAFMYFCIIVLPNIEGMKRRFRFMGSFFLTSFIAVMIDSIILLPTAVSVIMDRAEDANTFFNIRMPFGAILNQLFFGQAHGWVYAPLPYVYCGVIILMLFPLFFVLYRDSLKILLGWGTLLVVMVVSCYVDPLYLFWHAFDAPDGWNWRFSFLISFVLIVMSGLVFNRIEKVRKKEHFVLLCLAILFYFIYGKILRDSGYYYDTNTIIFGGINVALCLVYILVLNIYRMHKDEKAKSNTLLILGTIVVFELVANGYAITHRHLSGDTFVSSESYSAWVDDNKRTIELIDDDGFYRVRYIGEYAYNTDTMFGINGTSDFGTVENSQLRGTLRKLGVATSPKIIEGFGYTSFTDMILGVKYKIECSSFDRASYGGENSSSVKTNDKALGIAFLVDDNVLNCSLDSSNDFENINNLASSMVGYPLEIFDIYDDGVIDLHEDGIYYDYNNAKHVFMADTNILGERKISLSVPDDGREAYIQFELEDSVAYGMSPVLINGEENLNYEKGRLSEVYIKKMDISEYGNAVTIRMNDQSFQTAYIDDIYVAFYSDDDLQKMHQDLLQGQLEITELKNGYVRGNISVEENKMIFTSIPYERGWKVRANGREVEVIPIVNETFIGVKLPEGVYELEFEYTDPVMSIAMWVSVLGFMMLFIFRRKL